MEVKLNVLRERHPRYLSSISESLADAPGVSGNQYECGGGVAMGVLRHSGRGL